jgi:hypothetical protein
MKRRLCNLDFVFDLSDRSDSLKVVQETTKNLVEQVKEVITSLRQVSLKIAQRKKNTGGTQKRVLWGDLKRS